MPNKTWEIEFDLLWGEAPPDSLKGQKGLQIKAFIHSLLKEQREDVKLIQEKR